MNNDHKKVGYFFKTKKELEEFLLNIETYNKNNKQWIKMKVKKIHKI